MALTYDQHKAAIDAAYPTPPIEWVRQDDHVTFGLYEVASAELTFNGQSYHYLGRTTGLTVKKAGKSGVLWRFGGRVSLDGWYVSWDDAKTAFATHWEAHCERERVLLATSAYGKDVVDDEPGDVPVVRLVSLHLGAPAQTTIPLNPGFLDSRFEYAATTAISPVTLTATIPLGASVRWNFDNVVTLGQAVTIDLVQGGGNLVNCHVSQSGHRASNYGIVITRT